MLHGRIKRMVAAHGFGFIVDRAGLEWFFVETGVRGGRFAALRAEDHVVFAPEWVATGPRATDIVRTTPRAEEDPR